MIVYNPLTKGDVIKMKLYYDINTIFFKFVHKFLQFSYSKLSFYQIKLN